MATSLTTWPYPELACVFAGKDLLNVLCELIPKLKTRQGGGSRGGGGGGDSGGGGGSGTSGGGAQASSKKKKGRRK